MKNMIKTRPSKTEKTMMNMFDEMVIDYIQNSIKYGKYTVVPEADKNSALGVLRVLRVTDVITEELWKNCLDAIFSIQEG